MMEASAVKSGRRSEQCLKHSNALAMLVSELSVATPASSLRRGAAYTRILNRESKVSEVEKVVVITNSLANLTDDEA